MTFRPQLPILLLLFPAGLALADPLAGQWDSRFFLSSMNGPVHAIAVQGAAVYVGGQFTAAGGSPTTNLACWNGTIWSACGSGLDGAVHAIVCQGNEVFVGGEFTAAGGVPANRIARWDGSHWSALGIGLDGTVYALAIAADGHLYAGGEFTAAGGVSARNIACWNGAGWSSLGAGVNAEDVACVLALAVAGNDLYAGGTFTRAGSVSANNIARWDGTAWAALSDGVDDPDYVPQVAALIVRGTDLFVGGAFGWAGSTNANNIAQWDGTNWTPLGTGLERRYGDVPVTALTMFGGQLLAGGQFIWAGDIDVNNLAAWDGTNWMDLGGGVEGEVKALATVETNLWAGGNLVAAQRVKHLARWDGRDWAAVGGEVGQGILGDVVAAIAVNGRNLYIGGTFTFAGSVAARNIACWNGTAWAPLGDGLDGPIYALCVWGGDLFAGGAFTSAGGWSIAHVARWDGAEWWPLDCGVDGPVYALAGRDGTLFVGGTFTTAGGTPATNVAAWDGTHWTTLGDGLNGSVRALAVSSNVLYAGGSFRSAGGVAVTNVARWDDASWSALGSGVSGTANPGSRLRPPPVSALALQGSTLYVAGDFASAGGQAATNIAVWDGTRWSALGPGLRAPNRLYPPPTISTLWVNGNMVCAGGTFSAAGGMSLRNLALWDGSAWFMLGGGIGSGTVSSVQALTVLGSDFLVGGCFQYAGATVSANVALWRTPARLELKRAGALLTLQWSAILDPAFVLQCATRLNGSWLAATNTIRDAGPQRFVILNASPENRFYRLAE